MRRSLAGASSYSVDGQRKLFNVFKKGTESKCYADGAKVSDVFKKCHITGEGNKKLLTDRIDRLGYVVTEQEEKNGITVQGFIDKFLEKINKANGTDFKATYDPINAQGAARYY